MTASLNAERDLRWHNRELLLHVDEHRHLNGLGILFGGIPFFCAALAALLTQDARPSRLRSIRLRFLRPVLPQTVLCFRAAPVSTASGLRINVSARQGAPELLLGSVQLSGSPGKDASPDAPFLLEGLNACVDMKEIARHGPTAVLDLPAAPSESAASLFLLLSVLDAVAGRFANETPAVECAVTGTLDLALDLDDIGAGPIEMALTRRSRRDRLITLQIAVSGRRRSSAGVLTGYFVTIDRTAFASVG